MLWVRALSTFSRVLALVLTLEMCSPKVIPLSKVNPRIVGVGERGIGVLLSDVGMCVVIYIPGCEEGWSGFGR